MDEALDRKKMERDEIIEKMIRSDTFIISVLQNLIATKNQQKDLKTLSQIFGTQYEEKLAELEQAEKIVITVILEAWKEMQARLERKV